MLIRNNFPFSKSLTQRVFSIYNLKQKCFLREFRLINTSTKPENEKVDLRVDKVVTRLRGMHDLYGRNMRLHQHVTSTLTSVCSLYGYSPISTPILEPTSLFHRSLGQASSVMVGKELYSFEDIKTDRLDRFVTLRPEGTASIMRAINNDNLSNSLKLYYNGPMFRRERPQKGRLRQFHQFGVEWVGENSWWSDVEAIKLGYDVLKRLGLQDYVTLKINSLGDKEDRLCYIDKLKDYLDLNQSKLTDQSKNKLLTNPLRILDTKDINELEMLEQAPKIIDHLKKENIDRFNHILSHLNISYEIDHKLVRGLDYYNHTVWEFVANHPNLGKSQTAVLAGGRYDGLIDQLNGAISDKNRPGIGWACGIERLTLMLDTQHLSNKTTLMLVPLDLPNSYQATNYTNQLANNLRQDNIITTLQYPNLIKGSMNPTKILKKVMMEHPINIIPTFLIFIGQTELESQKVKIKKLDNKEEKEVDINQIKRVIEEW